LHLQLYITLLLLLLLLLVSELRHLLFIELQLLHTLLLAVEVCLNRLVRFVCRNQLVN
jgi:hypothetical protein